MLIRNSYSGFKWYNLVPMNKFSLSAILCAAGSSQRMGDQNKLLLPLIDQSILNHCVSSIIESDVDEVIVVLGHEYEIMSQELSPYHKAIKIVRNRGYKSGHTSSIQAGIKAINPKSDAFMICLSDMPLIKSKDYNRVIQFYSDHTEYSINRIVRPLYHQRPGHPVIMSHSYKEQILSCTDKEGCRSVIKDNRRDLLSMKTDQKCYIQDTDTPESYKLIIEGKL